MLLINDQVIAFITLMGYCSTLKYIPYPNCNVLSWTTAIHIFTVQCALFHIWEAQRIWQRVTSITRLYLFIQDNLVCSILIIRNNVVVEECNEYEGTSALLLER